MKTRVSRRLLALLMCLTVTLSFSAFAFADDGSDLTAKKPPPQFLEKRLLFLSVQIPPSKTILPKPRSLRIAWRSKAS